MRFLTRGTLLLAGACMMAGYVALAQSPTTPKAAPSVDVAVAYDGAQANIVPGNNFWLQGGSAQLHMRLWRGWGAAADVAVLHTGNMHGVGAGLDLLTATFGPRYTWSPRHGHYSVFGQFLAGEAHGMHSVFPGSSETTSSASSFASYLGGGFNLRLSPRLSVRLLEADWLRTQLPNTANNAQDNLRLGAGFIFRFR